MEFGKLQSDLYNLQVRSDPYMPLLTKLHLIKCAVNFFLAKKMVYIKLHCSYSSWSFFLSNKSWVFFIQSHVTCSACAPATLVFFLIVFSVENQMRSFRDVLLN